MLPSLRTPTAGLALTLAMLTWPGRAVAQQPVPSWPVDTCPRVAAETLREVRGLVRDPAGRPLPGALVGTMDRRCGTMTDALGRFGLRAPYPPGDSLLVEYIGFRGRSVAVPPGEPGDAPLLLEPVDLLDGELPALMPLRAAPEAAVTGALARSAGCYALSHDPEWWGAAELAAVVRVVIERRGTGAVLRVEDPAGGPPAAEPRNREWTVAITGDTLFTAWTRPGPFFWGMRYRLHPTDDGLNGLQQFESHEPGSRTEPEPTAWSRVECPAGVAPPRRQVGREALAAPVTIP